MSENINLLSRDRVKNTGQQKTLLVLKRLSIFCLLVTAGTSLIFFVLTLSPVFSNVKQQENTLLQNLNFTQSKIAKYLFVKDRITASESIINVRYPMDVVIAEIQQELPQDVSIDTINIQNKILNLKVSSPNLDSLNTIIDTITQKLRSKKIYSAITLQTISTDNVSQVYSLTLEANLL